MATTTSNNVGFSDYLSGAAFKQAQAEAKDPYLKEKEACKAKGGTWDAATNSCKMPEVKTDTTTTTSEQQNVKGKYEAEKGGYVAENGAFYPTSNQDFVPRTTEQNITFNKDGTVNYKTSAGEVTLSKEEYKAFQGKSGAITSNVAQANVLSPEYQQQIQAQQLAGQVGQFTQTEISPTGLDTGEAFTTGVVNAIPRALSYAVTGAGIGLGAGAVATGGVGAAPAAVIGAVSGFVSGLASSMISNFKSQRTDTINAQKRVLDEGKQNLNDWATLAASDPANRATYLNNFNLQLAQIDEAYRQMKLDTSQDLTKFNTAIPDLAEFEAFYSNGGERDALIREMQNSLIQDTNIDYRMLELAGRRK